MAATRSIIDSEAVLADLRLCSEYASRAGLLRDRTVIDALSAAEAAIRKGEEIDVNVLMLALNEVTRVIAPMTVADLTFGRDPFSAVNQGRARRAQLLLSLFALVAILVIGYFMSALRVEQAAVANVTEVQALHPELKLTALRNIAQHDEPIVKRSELYDDFQERISELREINARLYVAYSDALVASTMPLLPFGNLLDKQMVTTQQFTPATEYGSPVEEAAAASATATASLVDGGATSQHAASAPQPELCAEDKGGAMRLPGGATHYPQWMQSVLADTLSDFCFQLKVLSPDGDGAILSNQALGQLAFVSDIKEKVWMRVTWLLPFCYGLLGAVVFLIRAVASVRAPAMGFFPIIMRLSLGGIAGIIIGWFASSSPVALENTSALSLPFALAFLTGYGIDALFDILDRLNRAIGDAPKPKTA
jgi:hypothetical protein